MLSEKLFKHYDQSFDEIYISPESKDTEVAKRLKSLFPNKVQNYSKALKLQEINTGVLDSEDFNLSKRRLLVKKYEGKFFKQCPGGNTNSACCNYFVLNLGSQCHFNCSYCYLQNFINTAFMVIYSNIEDALEELTEVSKKMKDHKARIGTGEVIDSLGLDPLTLYSQKIIEHIKDLPNLQLELKTKSDFVDHLLNLNHGGNTTFSWSINPEHIIKNEEHDTASFQERIEAAKKALNAGYSLSFHIDPVIWHQDWKKNYSELVDVITQNFEPKDIPYVSLGALRFQPNQRHMMKERFSRASIVNQAEMFLSKDGKLRYDADLRSEMFKYIIECFKEKSRAWRVFLCMESPETWLSTYGSYPKQVEGLGDLFSPRPH